MTEKIITHLSEFVRTLMLKKGVTVRHLSELTGLSVGTISDMRNGKDMRIGYYINVCKALNVEPETIFPIHKDPLVNIITASSSKLNRDQIKAIINLIETI